MADNTILADYAATGASEQTAKQDKLHTVGRPASQMMAETDLNRVRALISQFSVAAEATGLPPALLAAIASRESRCGNVLDPEGFGDGGDAFGIMQVDKRAHPALAGLPDPKSQAHINQAAGILNNFFTLAVRQLPNLPRARQLQAAVAAYNCGIVRNPDVADLHTTGQDYSNDVWTRAQFLAARWPAQNANRPIA